MSTADEVELMLRTPNSAANPVLYNAAWRREHMRRARMAKRNHNEHAMRAYLDMAQASSLAVRTLKAKAREPQAEIPSLLRRQAS